MTKSSRAALVLAAGLSFGALAQGAQAPAGSELADYMRSLIVAPGLQVSVVHLNEATLPIVFQPPTIYAMRARTYERTLLFVQGTTEREVDFDPGRFELQQDGEPMKGQALNITNFRKAKVPSGQRLDGVVEFLTKLDLSKPFSVLYGNEATVFMFSEGQVQAATAKTP
jgi:hypothetical protein